jgi:hypothetical protein
MDAVREGLGLIEAAPLLGHGTGFARNMSELPHNIYIQQWVNNGLLGLLLYLGLIITAYLTFITRGSRNGVALIVIAAVGGIFSHNILDQRPFLILLGLLLGNSAHDSAKNLGAAWTGINSGAVVSPYGAAVFSFSICKVLSNYLKLKHVFPRSKCPTLLGK